jgi:hypothetical protein
MLEGNKLPPKLKGPSTYCTATMLMSIAGMQGYPLPSKSQVMHRMRQWSTQVDDNAIAYAPKLYTITVRFPTPRDADRAFRHLEKKAAGFFSAPVVCPFFNVLLAVLLLAPCALLYQCYGAEILNSLLQC